MCKIKEKPLNCSSFGWRRLKKGGANSNIERKGEILELIGMVFIKQDISIITIYLLFIGISKENRKFPENFLFCFDFIINS